MVSRDAGMFSNLKGLPCQNMWRTHSRQRYSLQRTCCCCSVVAIVAALAVWLLQVYVLHAHHSAVQKLLLLPTAVFAWNNPTAWGVQLGLMLMCWCVPHSAPSIYAPVHQPVTDDCMCILLLANHCTAVAVTCSAPPSDGHDGMDYVTSLCTGWLFSSAYCLCQPKVHIVHLWFSGGGRRHLRRAVVQVKLHPTDV